MKTFILLAALMGAASAVSFFEVVVEEWATWKFIHGTLIFAINLLFGKWFVFYAVTKS